MPRAVFLDRDGTIIEDAHYLSDPARIVLLPGVAEGLARLREAGFALVIVSNQSGLARGYFDETALALVERELERRFRERGVEFLASYHCPHLPEGTVAKYAVACDCRKPALGMIERAAREHGLALEDSWVVGDKPRDVERAHELGVRGILLGPAEPPPGVLRATDFRAAVDVILGAGTATAASPQ